MISLALPLRLANLMVQEKLITQEQLDKTLAAQKKTRGNKLGTALIAEGFIKENDLLDFVARQCGVSRIDLANLPEIPDEALAAVPKAIARKHLLIPFNKTKDCLLVAMSDPLNVLILDDLQVMTGCEVKAALASEREILAAQEKYYDPARKRSKAGGKAKQTSAAAEADEYPGDALPLDIPRRLADTLVEQGTITQAQLDEALEIRKKSQRKLGAILISKGFIAQETLLEFMAQQCGFGYVNLAAVKEIPEEVIALVPRKTAREHTLIPFDKTENCLMVAISDPLNVMILDELKLITGCEVKPVLAAGTDIKAAIDEHYQRKSEEASPDASAQAWEPPPE
ncbi:MAG: hypothetical protein HY922_13740, partial [Elusimicrobia bacterium]|nr:hypothetical protein [Elusimicrobiota bacterium]